MGIWDRGVFVRELTREDIEQLELQQQELEMNYGQEAGYTEEEEGEEEQDSGLEDGNAAGGQ